MNFTKMREGEMIYDCELNCFSRDNRELKGKLLRVELGNGGRKKRTEGCFTCGSMNHIAKDCSKNPRRDGKFKTIKI